jgi:hypothetical protein
VLTEVASGERLLPALFGFNLGVEAGQLAVVAMAWPVLRRLADLGAGAWHRTLVESASGAIAGLGVLWLVARAYG